MVRRRVGLHVGEHGCLDACRFQAGQRALEQAGIQQEAVGDQVEMGDAEAGGHKGHAAERLGISRHAFKRRLQRLGID